MATEYLDLDDALDGYAEAVEVSVEQASCRAFSDGNKRTAVVLLRAFLNLNGHDLTLSDDER